MFLLLLLVLLGIMAKVNCTANSQMFVHAFIQLQVCFKVNHRTFGIFLTASVFLVSAKVEGIISSGIVPTHTFMGPSGLRSVGVNLAFVGTT